MSTSYSEETQQIIDDFLTALSGKEKVDSELLTELRKMARNGTLDNGSRIQKALASLEDRANELHHR